MKRKILILISILVVLYTITWWVWGKDKLLVQAHDIMKNELNCAATTNFLDDRYQIIPVFMSENIDSKKIMGRDTVITIENWRKLFDAKNNDTSIVFRLHELKINNSNPFLTASGIQCTEFYYGDGFDSQWYFTTWAFIGWVKIIDGHTYQMLTNSDYRDIHTF